MGRPDDAEKAISRGLGILREIVAADPGRAEHRWALAGYLDEVGATWLSIDRYAPAAEALGEGVPKVELAHKALVKAVMHWPDAVAEQDRLRSAVLELEDLLALAQDQALRWSQAGADRIEAMEARLALYERLARRHRCEPEELAAEGSSRLCSARRRQEQRPQSTRPEAEQEAGRARSDRRRPRSEDPRGRSGGTGSPLGRPGRPECQHHGFRRQDPPCPHQYCCPMSE